MSAHIKPVAEINRLARSALIQELGVVDALRFLNQFRAGSGDYTTERSQLAEGESVSSLMSKIKASKPGAAE